MEHRLTDRLETYWNLLKKDQPMPDFSQFNTSAISDILQQCVIFLTQPSGELAPPVVNFYMIGEKLRPLFDDHMLGKNVSASQSKFNGARILRYVPQTINDPKILSDEGTFVGSNHKTIKFRSCLLPFGNKDAKVTHILVGISWREY